MGNVVAGFVGGIVAYGIGHVKTIEAWKVRIHCSSVTNYAYLQQAIFLVFGALTVAWSAAIYFILPDTQANARFLSKEDRVKAVHRVQENMTGIKNSTWKSSQALEALLDVQVWLLIAIEIAIQIANGGLQGVSKISRCVDYCTNASEFASIIIKGFGFSTLNALLVQMISTAFQGVFVIASTFGSTYFKNARTYFMAGNVAISLIGVVLIRELDAAHVWPRFIGFGLSLAYTANIPLILSVSSGNFGGFTKKTTVNAMVCHF